MNDHADGTWSTVIAARRRSLGLRQEELAGLADVSTRFVHAVESGKPTLRLEKFVALLEALGLSLTIESPTNNGDDHTTIRFEIHP